MKNFITGKTVPPELSTGWNDTTMNQSVTIGPVYPGYFSHRIFTDPTYDLMKTDAFTDISIANLKEIPAKADGYTGNWATLQAEVDFLNNLGLIVEKDGKRYVSPLALVFYGEGGLFVNDFESEISRYSNPEDRLEFLTPILNLFAKFVLPGRIMRVTALRGQLPDSIQYGNALTQEITEMGSLINHIRSLL